MIVSSYDNGKYYLFSEKSMEKNVLISFIYSSNTGLYLTRKRCNDKYYFLCFPIYKKRKIINACDIYNYINFISKFVVSKDL